MNDNQKKFAALFKQVLSHRKPSALLKEIRRVLLRALAHEGVPFTADRRIVATLTRRIEGREKGKSLGHILGYGPLMWMADGEWTVSNADLKNWADICLFGERDYFGDDWRDVEGSITSALHQCRRYQSFLRYQRRGGVTVEHRRLLAALNWQVDYSRGDWVSVFVEGKRPTGNSGRAHEFARAMGWNCRWAEKDRDMPKTQEERAWQFFDELPFVLGDIFAADKLPK